MSALSYDERQELSRFISQNCANFDSDGKSCLPHDRPCYMLSEDYIDGTACKYFKHSVMSMNHRIAAMLAPGAGMGGLRDSG